MSRDDYNYRSFTPEIMAGSEFSQFRDGPHAGDDAPQGTVVDAASGEEIALATLWRTQHVVIEFGSMT